MYPFLMHCLPQICGYSGNLRSVDLMGLHTCSQLLKRVTFSISLVGRQVFARSSKFSLFDPAKEMVYIEMRPDEKAQGKAAVDLLGSQIGKTGASWATQALLILLGSIRAAMPLVSVVYVGVISAWIVAVNHLAKQMKVPNLVRSCLSSVAQWSPP
jgi:ATP/ADP translocase